MISVYTVLGAIFGVPLGTYLGTKSILRNAKREDEKWFEDKREILRKFEENE